MKILVLLCWLMMAFPAWAEDGGQVDALIAKNDETELIDNKIYFFAHSMCVSCKDAFVYFQTEHRDLNILITDMKEKHNLDLYKQCVKKFGIKNSELRLPLICMGDNYIMGWTKEDEYRFNQYLSAFLGR